MLLVSVAVPATIFAIDAYVWFKTHILVIA